MIVLDRLLVGGIKFVLGKVVQAVDNELNDDGVLREELLAAQMRHELGEISSDELAAIETDVLARLREVAALKGGGAPIDLSGASGVATVEATFGGDEPGEK